MDIFLAVCGCKVKKKVLEFGDKYMHSIIKHTLVGNIFWKNVFLFQPKLHNFDYILIMHVNKKVAFQHK